MSVLSSHHLSYYCHRCVMVLSWANNLPIIYWFLWTVTDLPCLGHIFDESIFFLIGEFIISLIVECHLLTNKTWKFSIVGALPWIISHVRLFFPENSFIGLWVLWNKKMNFKPPWSWVIVTPILQRDEFHIYSTIRRKMECLCEDMEWKMMEFDDYQCQFEKLRDMDMG